MIAFFRGRKAGEGERERGAKEEERGRTIRYGNWKKEWPVACSACCLPLCCGWGAHRAPHPPPSLRLLLRADTDRPGAKTRRGADDGILRSSESERFFFSLTRPGANMGRVAAGWKSRPSESESFYFYFQKKKIKILQGKVLSGSFVSFETAKRRHCPSLSTLLAAEPRFILSRNYHPQQRVF